VDHLAALGHIRIAFVSGPRHSWSNQQRRSGLRAAARTHSCEVLTIGPVAPQFDSGLEAAERVLSTGATAVLAYNDLVAVGILSRLAELKITVPGGLSVIGFDDIPLAAMVTPPLTTVAAPTVLAGQTAVQALLDRLEHRRQPLTGEVRTLPATLVVRGSTAPPAPAAARTPRSLQRA